MASTVSAQPAAASIRPPQLLSTLRTTVVSRRQACPTRIFFTQSFFGPFTERTAMPGPSGRVPGALADVLDADLLDPVGAQDVRQREDDLDAARGGLGAAREA